MYVIKNVQCKMRIFLIDLNPVELKYYLYTITSDKCNGSCNALTEISDKICVPNENRKCKFKCF